MKQVVFILMALGLAGCGQHERFDGRSGSSSGASVSRSAPMAFGPISKACMASDRKARSRALCGCIQAAANQTLNASQQRRAVAFYDNPHRAQEVRQSDRTNDERFREAYRYSRDRAKRLRA